MADGRTFAEKAGLTGVAGFLALVVVVMWLVFIVVMALHIGADKEEWARWITIMTALQALAFAAAGALWGVKVQEKETDKANDDKKQAVGAAVEGKTLANMIERALARGERKGNLDFLGDDADLSALRDQAQKVQTMPLP